MTSFVLSVLKYAKSWNNSIWFEPLNINLYFCRIYNIYDVTNTCNGKFLKIRNAFLIIYTLYRECKTWVWKSTEKLYLKLFF